MFQGYRRVYTSCFHHWKKIASKAKGPGLDYWGYMETWEEPEKTNISYCIRSISCNCSVSCSTSYSPSLPSTGLCFPFILLTSAQWPWASGCSQWHPKSLSSRCLPLAVRGTGASSAVLSSAVGSYRQYHIITATTTIINGLWIYFNWFYGKSGIHFPPKALFFPQNIM